MVDRRGVEPLTSAVQIRTTRLLTAAPNRTQFVCQRVVGEVADTGRSVNLRWRDWGEKHKLRVTVDRIEEGTDEYGGAWIVLDVTAKNTGRNSISEVEFDLARSKRGTDRSLMPSLETSNVDESGDYSFPSTISLDPGDTGAGQVHFSTDSGG